jgi:Clp amino terminal domain, pathogenicity island component
MSGISSISATGSNNLLSYLTSTSKSSQSKRSSDANDSQPAGPLDFLTQELESQGYTGTSLQDLLAKIGDAIEAQQTASGGQSDPGALRDAIDKVLKDAGVDTDKIHQDFKAHRSHGSAPAQPAGGESALDILLGDDADGNDDSILKSFGVDPSQYAQALQNIGSNGSAGLSQLLASAAPGSLINLLA